MHDRMNCVTLALALLATGAAWSWVRHVVSIRRCSVTRNFTVDLCSAASGVFVIFKNENGRCF